MRRQPIALLALLMVLASCATVAPESVDLTGRWIGTWSGHGVLDVPRDEPTTLDLVQAGQGGRGRLVMEGTLAAESVPLAIRNVGTTGVRVIFDISADRIRLEHELGSHLFAAEMVVRGDRMRGYVLGVTPHIAFDLIRAKPI